eukprot:TRINITY_DN91942_c0_g1_i1.p1 TRINITY_DN91942_c0_g1~~TRINITY_DN91942_c0_g1_i1.p1  ORF type:complete len:754 (+),score=169.24 TRINITY_DN91942_c0_g1_i1:23-2263(+)
MGTVALACGDEQVAVLPSAAGLAACFVGYAAYSTSLLVRNSGERESRKRRASELYAAASNERATVSVEPKAVGKKRSAASSAVASDKLQEGELQQARATARAIREDRLLMVDRSSFLVARSRLQVLKRLMSGACVAAAAQPGADLLFSVCRLLLLALLWAEPLCFTGGTGLGSSIEQRFNVLSRCSKGGGGGIKSPHGISRHPSTITNDVFGRGDRRQPSSVVRCLGPPAPFAQTFQRIRIALLNLAALLLLLWFEIFRHPQIRNLACSESSTGDAWNFLLNERSSALTMLAVWILSGLMQVAAMRCEACVWLAPRAEELLSEHLDTDQGFLLGGKAFDVAEVLCGPQTLADVLLQELQDDFSIVVMDGIRQLRPSSSSAFSSKLAAGQSLRELTEIPCELRTEFQKLREEIGHRLEEVIRSLGAGKCQPPSREMLLSTRLDKAMGEAVLDRKVLSVPESDSGESSEEWAGRASFQAEGGADDTLNLATSGRVSMAQLLQHDLQQREQREREQPQGQQGSVQSAESTSAPLSEQTHGQTSSSRDKSSRQQQQQIQSVRGQAADAGFVQDQPLLQQKLMQRVPVQQPLRPSQLQQQWTPQELPAATPQRSQPLQQSPQRKDEPKQSAHLQQQQQEQQQEYLKQKEKHQEQDQSQSRRASEPATSNKGSATNGPRRYSERRLLMQKQRTAAKAAPVTPEPDWEPRASANRISPAPPSPPWNVESVTAPSVTAQVPSPPWNMAEGGMHL